jgi:hypothetical protein
MSGASYQDLGIQLKSTAILSSTLEDTQGALREEPNAHKFMSNANSLLKLQVLPNSSNHRCTVPDCVRSS